MSRAGSRETRSELSGALRGARHARLPAVANLVNFDVIHGSGSNDFGTIIASFPVSRVPDVFFALSGADLTQLLEEWRTLRL